jgi:cellulose synthase/poly-beta-1,6-N-acetylglucosamine synthase-like glycosyltransferase
MLLICEIIFWVCVALALHTYLGYPLILRGLVWIKTNLKRTSSQTSRTLQGELPSVTVLISAYNEQSCIEQRLRNLAEQTIANSPSYQVLIGSDGSTDATAEILTSLSKEYSWLTVHCVAENRGKALMTNDLLDKAVGDIILFTDADVLFEPDCIELLLKRFAHDKVGGVEARIIIESPTINADYAQSETAYYDYDTRIRTAQDIFGVVTGMKGQCYALRRKLVEPIPVNEKGAGVTDDLFHSLLALEQGYMMHFEQLAIARTPSAPSLAGEFRRKVRFSATTFATLKYFPKVVFSTKPMLLYSFWSHRIMKWYFPFVMILAFITNVALITDGTILYGITLALQVLFYVLALVGWSSSGQQGIHNRVFTYPTYFVVANIALLVGFMRFLSGNNFTRWEPQR